MYIIYDKRTYAVTDFLQADLTTDHTKNVQSFLKFWYAEEETFTLHTSGSTGKPKAISVSKEQMRLSAGATIRFFDLNGGKALLCLGTDRVAGIMMIVRAILANMDLIIVEPKANPLEEITGPIQFAAMVPYQVKMVLEQSPDKLKQIDKLIIGGASLQCTEREQLLSLKINAYETYGMTETVSHVALKHISETEFKFLPGITGYLDERGCLVLRTLLSESDIKTNDVVEFSDYNAFIWKGRADFVINSGGVKIHPEELEKKLETIFSSNGERCQFFITSEKDSRFGEIIVLYLEDPKEFQEAWLNDLPTYEKPKKVYKLKAFKWTESGKVDRLRTGAS